MINQPNIDETIATFRRFASNSKIILLHPASRLRTMLVARLVSDPGFTSFYYALDIDDKSLRDFLIHFIHDLSKQQPTFGRHLSRLRTAVHEDPKKHLDTILNAFIAELSELDDGEFYLILDEYDRADTADDIQHFVERLSQQLPMRSKLVLNGRTLPRLPWLSMIAKGQAIMLRDSALVREDFHANLNEDGAALNALSIGPGYVFLDDHLVDDWEGHLPRLLLFYALDRPVITRNEICDAFWPDLDLDSAVNVYHVTKRRLHKALDMEVLRHAGAYYQINPEVPFYSDTFEFVKLLMVGRYGNPDDPLELWQRVAKLYRGPFLQGHDDDWIEARRDAYLIAYIEALDNLARLWDERGRHELALHTLLRAVESDYSNEAIHQNLLERYVQLGRRAEAVSHFRSVEAWARENKVSLSSKIRQLFSEISA